MNTNYFFKNKGPFPLKKIIEIGKGEFKFKQRISVNIIDIKDLHKAKKNEIFFLNSAKYKDVALKTKATACITNINLSKFLPNNCLKIFVHNISLSVARITKLFYPQSDIDYLDKSLKPSNKIKKKYPKVIFGQNVLIGKNVKIGKNSKIASNSIIESNVNIGENCTIGSFVTIRNSFISNNVYIQDGSKIGIKGFGFIPNKNKNIRTPHVGKVILEEGVEIGANSTIDRGSLANTVIGKNTFLDNQVHVAHNVQIGKNCMIAGQVGFAGSSTLGDNVVIGGQAGISGHLNIGNNVKIGGGSGVINDIPDNHQVMGYPAVPLKEFVKQRKK